MLKRQKTRHRTGMWTTSTSTGGGLGRRAGGRIEIDFVHFREGALHIDAISRKKSIYQGTVVKEDGKMAHQDFPELFEAVFGMYAPAQFEYYLLAPPLSTFKGRPPHPESAVEAGWAAVKTIGEFSKLVSHWENTEQDRLLEVAQTMAVEASAILARTPWTMLRNKVMQAAKGEAIGGGGHAAHTGGIASESEQLASIEILRGFAGQKHLHVVFTPQILGNVVSILEKGTLLVRQACMDLIWLMCSASDAAVNKMLGKGLVGTSFCGLACAP